MLQEMCHVRYNRTPRTTVQGGNDGYTYFFQKHHKPSRTRSSDRCWCYGKIKKDTWLVGSIRATTMEQSTIVNGPTSLVGSAESFGEVQRGGFVHGVIVSSQLNQEE